MCGRMWSSWLGRGICLSQWGLAVRSAVVSQGVEVRRATDYVCMFIIRKTIVYADLWYIFMPLCKPSSRWKDVLDDRFCCYF